MTSRDPFRDADRYRGRLEHAADRLTGAITRFDTAWQRLADAQPGYPTQAPSTPAPRPTPKLTERPDGMIAWSCTRRLPSGAVCAAGVVHTDLDAMAAYARHWDAQHRPETSTQPERHAAILTDDALTHATALARAVNLAESVAIEIDQLTTTWATTRIGTTVASTPTAGWCPSCLRVGERQPLRQGSNGAGTRCWWCDRTLRAVNDLRRRHGKKPLDDLPKAAVEHHHTTTSAGRRPPTRDAQIHAWAGIPLPRPTTPARPWWTDKRKTDR